MNRASPNHYYNPEAHTQTKRNRLPHWQQGQTWTFLTWRLGDSLPKGRLHQWRAERATWIKQHPEPWDNNTESEYHERFTLRIDEWLDQGRGSCVLRERPNAKIVARTLNHFTSIP